MFFYHSTLDATTFSRLPIDELYEYSDFVGLVELFEGNTLGIGQESCGALYTGHVISQFKGENQKSIVFGHYYGFEIGRKYLLFLSKPGQEKRFLNSTNSFSESGREAELIRCKEQRIGWNVMHSGIAAIGLESSPELNFKNGFAIPTRYIEMPEILEAFEGDFGSKEKYRDMKWFKDNSVLELSLIHI